MTTESKDVGLKAGLQEYVDQFEHGHPEPTEPVTPKEAASSNHSEVLEKAEKGLEAGLKEYVSQFEHGSQEDSEKVAAK
eukprot:gene28373-35220_t